MCVCKAAEIDIHRAVNKIQSFLKKVHNVMSILVERTHYATNKYV